MNIKRIRDILISVLSIALILSISYGVILYGKGYRFDFFSRAVKPTGLLAATSDPTGAQVYIDGKLTTATNNTINITPGWYTVRIVKEGYQPWEKYMEIKSEIVSRADAYLFPTNPSLSTLTTMGVVNPVLSPDGGRLAYIIPDSQEATADGILAKRSGIWILNLEERPLGFSRDAVRIASSDIIDFSKAVITWSPDSAEMIAAIAPVSGVATSYYLLDANRTNDIPKRLLDVTDTLEGWNTLQTGRELVVRSNLKEPLADIYTTFMKDAHFSPDEYKILYEASISGALPLVLDPPVVGVNSTDEVRDLTPGTLYVYDIKEDRNYRMGTTQELGLLTPEEETEQADNAESALSVYRSPSPIQWLPTSRHLILLTEDKIEAMDYDGTNRKTLYAGPFWDGFMTPWINASRILIMTTLNPIVSTLPNLYAVNLR